MYISSYNEARYDHDIRVTQTRLNQVYLLINENTEIGIQLLLKQLYTHVQLYDLLH